MRKALIVEDNKMDQNIIKYYLERSNFQCTVCSNAYDAIEEIDEDLDIIFIDIHMPQFSGFQLQRRIRNYCKRVGIPIVVMTAEKVDSQTVFRALNNGAKDFIVKPINFETFAEKLNKMKKMKLIRSE